MALTHEQETSRKWQRKQIRLRATALLAATCATILYFENVFVWQSNPGSERSAQVEDKQTNAIYYFATQNEDSALHQRLPNDLLETESSTPRINETANLSLTREISSPIKQTEQSNNDAERLDANNKEAAFVTVESKNSLQVSQTTTDSIHETSTMPYEIVPMERLVQDNKVIGNVSDLLQYAIIGFPKCGTSTLSLWIEQHAEIDAVGGESWALTSNDPAKLTWWLASKRRQQIESGLYDDGRPLPKQGYKQPKDVYLPQVFELFAEYWPEARLIVTMRHPVTWFESYVNFRSEGMFFHSMLGRRSKIGNPKETLTTGLGEYHIFLSLMGKTLQNQDSVEWPLLKSFLMEKEYSKFPFPRIPNPIFLVETSQMSDTNQTRVEQLRDDMTRYLGLRTALPDMPHIRPEVYWESAEQLKEKKENRLSICGQENLALRNELLRIGAAAAEWTREYFIPQPDVFVSSEDYFVEALEKWKVDPCIKRQKEKA